MQYHCYHGEAGIALNANLFIKCHKNPNYNKFSAYLLFLKIAVPLAADDLKYTGKDCLSCNIGHRFLSLTRHCKRSDEHPDVSSSEDNLFPFAPSCIVSFPLFASSKNSNDKNYDIENDDSDQAWHVDRHCC